MNEYINKASGVEWYVFMRGLRCSVNYDAGIME